MKNMFRLQSTQSTNKSDIVGAFASSLCLLHCVATPFLFIAGAGAVGHHHHHHGDTPLWWSAIDIIFIVISFFAIYFSVKTSTKNWIKYALVANWIFLTFIILNEKFEILHLAEAWVYLPALSLVALHLYNRKYCQCKDGQCATVPNKTEI